MVLETLKPSNSETLFPFGQVTSIGSPPRPAGVLMATAPIELQDAISGRKTVLGR